MKLDKSDISILEVRSKYAMRDRVRRHAVPLVPGIGHGEGLVRPEQQLAC